MTIIGAGWIFLQHHIEDLPSEMERRGNGMMNGKIVGKNGKIVNVNGLVGNTSEKIVRPGLHERR